MWDEGDEQKGQVTIPTTRTHGTWESRPGARVDSRVDDDAVRLVVGPKTGGRPRRPDARESVVDEHRRDHGAHRGEI